MELTPLQKTVITKARQQLRRHPKWSKQVCLDHLQDDYTINKLGLDKCAEEVALDTAYWEEFLLDPISPGGEK
jgi:hypothetical protein